MGFVFPLPDIFPLKASEQYEALAVLPGGSETGEPLAAGPIKIRLPEPQVVGVNRPPYGSTAFWDALAGKAGAVRGGLALKCNGLAGQGTGTFFRPLRAENWGGPRPKTAPVPRLAMTLTNNSSGPVSVTLLPQQGADQAILLRNDQGTPLPPNLNQADVGIGWPFDRDGNYLYPPGQDSSGGSSAQGTYDLGLVYPLRAGGRYEVLAAVSIRGEINGVVVAKPVWITVPDGSPEAHAAAGPPAVVSAPPRTGTAAAPATAGADRSTDLAKFAGAAVRWAARPSLATGTGRPGADPAQHGPGATGNKTLGRPERLEPYRPRRQRKARRIHAPGQADFCRGQGARNHNIATWRGSRLPTAAR